MGQLAVFIPYIVAAIGAEAALSKGAAQKEQAYDAARQMERRAGQTRASAQRAAASERRDARYVSSRARANAAASGGGVSDPTIVNVLADIQTEGEYNALAHMYQGEESALGDESAAVNARKSGKAAEKAGYLQAGMSILSAFGPSGAGTTGTTGTNTFAGKYGDASTSSGSLSRGSYGLE